MNSNNTTNNNIKKLSFALISVPATTNASSTVNNIAESGALFRSVSMGGLSAPPPLSTHSRSVGTLMKAHSSPFPEDVFSPSVVGTLTKPTEPEHEWEWKLSHSELSPVPLYHPMERTAVVITDIAVEEIARRISKFLKQNSITAQYEASRVSCMTDSLLKFVIHLWQSPQGVIIEVQRRQGCCIAMQAIRHHLVEAIQTGPDRDLTPAQVPSRGTCSVVQTLLDQMLLPPPPQDLPCCSSGLELAKHLLQSDRFDAQRLGLESLCSLTNPTQVLLRDADHVSRTLLMEPEWQRLMSRYFQARNVQDDDIASALHFLALKTVTQAIEAVTANSVKHTPPTSTPFWSLLVEDLFQNLINASTCPLEASLSTRCFRYLQVLHPELLRSIYNNANLYEYLVQAHDFGKHHHRSLEMETEQWMGRLGFAY